MTSTTTTTSAARRRQRIADRLAGAEASEVTAEALTVLSAIARREAQRIPSGLTALTADDVAQSTALRLLSTSDGALSLAALTSASLTARQAARRTAERAARSVVGTAVRRETIGTTEAQQGAASAEALTAEHTSGPLAHRGAAEAEAVRLALDASDRRDVRIDSDHQRTYALGAAGAAGYRAGKAAARRGGLGAEAGATLAAEAGALAVRHAAGRGWQAVSEQTTATAVRLVRVQSLEAMLTSALRVPLPTTGAGAESSGRGLAGIMSDRTIGAAFRAEFETALAEAVTSGTGRGAEALRTHCATLTGRSAAQWTAAAQQRQRLACEAEAEADRDAWRLTIARQESTSASAIREAGQTASDSARRAEAARTLAQVLTSLALTGRPVTLAALVWHSLTATPDQSGRGASRGGAAKRRSVARETPHLSTLDTSTLLTILTGEADTTSNAARALRAAITSAASEALDGASVRPAPSVRLSHQRAASARLARQEATEAHARRQAQRGAHVGRHVRAALVSALAVWQPVTA